MPTVLRLLLAPALLLGVLLAGCSEFEPPPPIERDFEDILAGDTLVVLMSSNSTSYFVYRGEPMGFEYDLIRDFADAHELVLRVRLVNHPDSLFPMLRRGDGDIAASRLLPDTTDTFVSFTRAIYSESPMLVQAIGEPQLPDTVEDVIEEGESRSDTASPTLEQAPDPRLAPPPPEEVTIRARRVETPRDLAGDTVYVAPASPERRHLMTLADEVGQIHIVEVEDSRVEDLIQQVAFAEIDMTVSPENLARLQADRFENIVIHPTLAEPQPVSWAVRPNAPILREALDEWIADSISEARYNALYQRYFNDRQGYRQRVESTYLTSETGRLSDFDDLFERYSLDIGWDWRLLASLAYQESRFDPRARSWAGATGLIQLMPPTAREFGVTNMLDPEDNVAGGTRFIAWLQNYWHDRIEDEDQRIRFVLASYNTGHGHVEDARRLAAADGLDDTYWPDVAFWLLQKSDPAVYQNPIVRYGYSRGIEPVTYVQVILERFDHYRQFVRPEDYEREADPSETDAIATAS